MPLSARQASLTLAVTIMAASVDLLLSVGPIQAAALWVRPHPQIEALNPYRDVRGKPRRRGAKWTALDGIFSCMTKTKALELAELIVRARSDWRIVDDARTMVGPEDGEGECQRIERIRFDFADIEFVRELYDRQKVAALVFHPKPPSGRTLKEKMDRQIDAMNSDDSPDPNDGYYVLARPALVEWIFEPGTRTH